MTAVLDPALDVYSETMTLSDAARTLEVSLADICLMIVKEVLPCQGEEVPRAAVEKLAAQRREDRRRLELRRAIDEERLSKQLEVVLALIRDWEVATMSGLARSLDVSTAAIRAKVPKLVRLGYVERTHPGRWSSTYQLTAAGRQYAARHLGLRK